MKSFEESLEALVGQRIETAEPIQDEDDINVGVHFVTSKYHFVMYEDGFTHVRKKTPNELFGDYQI